ncbi:MAG: hypothetical protein VX278_00385, partial [Myxococcota bacterium]|nr:hypothetical protein [Myxococcota bacterium]
GSIYDEALVVPPSLWWFRLYVILWSALFLCLAQWYREPKSRPLGLWCVGLLFGLLAIRLQAPSLMSQHNHASVRDALGAQAESEHFLFYYDREQIDADLLPFLLEDAEFRYWELQRYLQEDPVAWKGRKIEIYIYPSAEVQFRLMGSRNTFVARPWTHQVHLRWDGYTDSVLAHEVAHIFTAPFGRGPLKMAGKGAFLIDTGMVEGIAVAADWRPEDLNPHLASAALRKMNKAPDLRSLFSAGGFWAQPSGKAYTMTGSFVRWLVEAKGIEPYKTLYRSGDFQKAYERDAAFLIMEWERYLDQIPLTERTLSMAQYRYDRRSIFQKSCARSMAEKRRQARVAVRSDDFERALLLYRELEQREAGSFRLQLQIIRVLMMLERWEEANLAIEDSLSQEPSSAYVARLNEYKGDIEWRRGNTNDAIDSYRGCQEMGLVDSRMRTLEAKIVGIESSSVQRYLLDRNTRSKMLYLAMDWQSRSDNPLADYLVGVQLHGLLEFPAVIQALEPIVLSSAILEEQRMFLLAQAYFHTGRLSESKALWKRLANGTNTRLQMESEEWLRRIVWKEEVSKK